MLLFLPGKRNFVVSGSLPGKTKLHSIENITKDRESSTAAELRGRASRRGCCFERQGGLFSTLDSFPQIIKKEGDFKCSAVCQCSTVCQWRKLKTRVMFATISFGEWETEERGRHGIRLLLGWSLFILWPCLGSFLRGNWNAFVISIYN